jgi:hypothetical protein
MKTAIEILFDKAGMTCTKCGAKIGYCDCWTKCKIPGCSWSFEKGSKCRNPEHKK